MARDLKPESKRWSLNLDERPATILASLPQYSEIFCIWFDLRFFMEALLHHFPSRKQTFEEQGFVVVPGLVPAESRSELEAACERAISRTRSGSWTLRRTVGRQFPPYGNDDPDSWGVQHVMHPDLGDPHSPADATEDEERDALAIWHHGVQWNTALYRDSCLYVVPGSHKIPRSPEQRLHSSTLDPPANPLDMPGAIQVILQPGETVFYNNNILHCATYNPVERRATLHASMGDIRGGATRARNILQHGLEWMKEEHFRKTLDERGQRMLNRIIKLQESVNGDIGYSLAN
ncbi:hypothetical protein A0H81_07087 [Grifola frondosa]|uniref:Uncharacterized protein n=1 Tax=Grifola frondosa TaxID=5627 RepID=A0A1C7M7F2_GRIFR|nr:hypothetical protein A0H81_07087 [Grifola frondosa]